MSPHLNQGAGGIVAVRAQELRRATETAGAVNFAALAIHDLRLLRALLCFVGGYSARPRSIGLRRAAFGDETATGDSAHQRRGPPGLQTRSWPRTASTEVAIPRHLRICKDGSHPP